MPGLADVLRTLVVVSAARTRPRRVLDASVTAGLRCLNGCPVHHIRGASSRQAGDAFLDGASASSDLGDGAGGRMRVVLPKGVERSSDLAEAPGWGR